jgi:hypothetical protein
MSEWKKVSIELIIVTIIEVLQLISIWSIDVSVGGMVSGSNLYNGFGYFEAAKIYHISMYVMIITSIILVGLIIYVSCRWLR